MNSLAILLMIVATAAAQCSGGGCLSRYGYDYGQSSGTNDQGYLNVDPSSPYQPYESPYGPAPSPYVPVPYRPAPYGPAPSPYGPDPYGPAPSPYGPAPYGPVPYGPTPYGPAPYGLSPYTNLSPAPFGGMSEKKDRTDAYALNVLLAQQKALQTQSSTLSGGQ